MNSTSPDAAGASWTPLDVGWLLLNGSLVFAMQIGFCMLEAGSVTSKSTESIMLKNMCDLALTAILWWAVGYALAFDQGNGFIGGSGGARLFFASGVDDAYESALFFFHFTFCSTAATIVSGAIAERANILAYLTFSTACATIIYPVVAHWEWSVGGWASPSNAHGSALLGGVIDFAGGGAVHVVGGVASLCGAAIIGPRRGRFLPPAATGRARHTAVPMPGHSSVLQVLGTFMLWFGWYGFNGGSTLRLGVGDAKTAARVMITTTLAGSSAAITSGFFMRFAGKTQSWDVDAVCNGALAGLVSVTSGCATMQPWAALLVGVVGAFAYMGGSRAVVRFLIDDPLDAAAVHGTCGAWALLSAALFSTDTYTREVYGGALEPGLFYPGSSGERLAVAAVFVVAVSGWVGATSSAVFLLLRRYKHLRMPDKLEEIDMDASITPAGAAFTSMVFDPPLQGAAAGGGIVYEPQPDLRPDTRAAPDTQVQLADIELEEAKPAADAGDSAQ